MPSDIAIGNDSQQNTVFQHANDAMSFRGQHVERCHHRFFVAYNRKAMTFDHGLINTLQCHSERTPWMERMKALFRNATLLQKCNFQSVAQSQLQKR